MACFFCSQWDLGFWTPRLQAPLIPFLSWVVSPWKTVPWSSRVDLWVPRALALVECFRRTHTEVCSSGSGNLHICSARSRQLFPEGPPQGSSHPLWMRAPTSTSVGISWWLSFVGMIGATLSPRVPTGARQGLCGTSAWTLRHSAWADRGLDKFRNKEPHFSGTNPLKFRVPPVLT